jgi:hypothetical protein
MYISAPMTILAMPPSSSSGHAPYVPVTQAQYGGNPQNAAGHDRYHQQQCQHSRAVNWLPHRDQTAYRIQNAAAQA